MLQGRHLPSHVAPGTCTEGTGSFAPRILRSATKEGGTLLAQAKTW